MSKALTIQATVEIRLPTIPNFLHILVADKEVPIDVADIQVSDLRTLSKEWGEALVEHAVERRKYRDAEANKPKLRKDNP